MAQIYRIYINETTLLLSGTIETAFSDYQLLDPESFDFSTFSNCAILGKLTGNFVLLSPNVKRLFKQIKNRMKFIKAAGGLVSNEQNQHLFIFRNGKWDLPKGKLENGENTKNAALREVEEECGIKISKVGRHICKTYHIYQQGRNTILKKTSWYKMQANKQPILKPQLEEGITDARWVRANDFMLVKENTFPLILDIIKVIEN
ncbi:MAG: NUDIX domain-containing protein [Daejeonella sp.]